MAVGRKVKEENGGLKEGDVLEGAKKERKNGEADGVREVMLLSVKQEMQ